MSEQKEKNMPEEKLPEAKLPESAPVSEGEALTALADAILATDEPEAGHALVGSSASQKRPFLSVRLGVAAVQ